MAGEHRGRWTIQTYHHTGTPYADELCPHYSTLAAARESIDEAALYDTSPGDLDGDYARRAACEAADRAAR